MNIKKLMVLLVAAAMILSLAACSKLGNDTKTQAGTGSYSADAAFTFTDGAITATGESSGYEIDGTYLTIEASGTYLLSGECSDGNAGGMQPGGNMGDMHPPSGKPGGQKPDGEPPAKPE